VLSRTNRTFYVTNQRLCLTVSAGLKLTSPDTRYMIP